MDEQLRKKLLKPISFATRLRTSEAAGTAVQRLVLRGANTLELAKQLERFSGRSLDGSPPRWRDPDEVRDSVLFAKTLYASRRISRAEYILFAAAPIESIHDARCSDGAYDEDLRRIKEALDAVERKHGLGPNEYWTIAQAPIEYRSL